MVSQLFDLLNNEWFWPAAQNWTTARQRVHTTASRWKKWIKKYERWKDQKRSGRKARGRSFIDVGWSTKARGSTLTMWYPRSSWRGEYLPPGVWIAEIHITYWVGNDKAGIKSRQAMKNLKKLSQNHNFMWDVDNSLAIIRSCCTVQLL